ncbi:MAG: alpha/beta hydrolase-fold protein [Geothrix sp.]|uniref:alpha/beta hydrolase n=1 Tax=Geothrix sp. TaxID=1962974 RepID=UPI003BAEDF63
MPAWRFLALWITLLAASFPVRAVTLERIPSARLKREVSVALHVPSAEVTARWTTAHPNQPMQLVLFLPGAWDGPEDFLREGLEAFLADQESKNELPPSLWVAVTHFQSWYADRLDGSFPYERFLMDELLPLLEARHPGFGGTPHARSIAGLSMGGFGALNLAARTGAFSRCLALSPAFVKAPFDSYQWFIRRSLRRTFPQDPALFAPWNPWTHLGGSTELVIGAGTEDRYNLAGACRTFARLSEERGRPVQVDLRPGGHDWAYWTPTFKDWMPWLIRGPRGVPGGRPGPGSTAARLGGE